MLKHWMLVLMLAGLIYYVPATVAQDSGTNGTQGPPSGQQPEHGGRHFDPQQRTEMLTRQLKLTPDQQAKVLDILKSAQSQMESLRSDSSTPRQDRRSKMMEIHKSSDDQIRAVLDPNQQKKWDAMQARREQWMSHHQGQPPSSPDASEQK